jgi:hypothetical protein
MKKYIGILICLLIMFTYATYICSAQTAVASSGGNATGTAGAVSFTVGQMVYSELAGQNGTSLTGIQHSFERVLINGIAKNDGIDLGIIAFPNPALDFIKLKTETFISDDLSFRLYNSQGTQLLDKKIESDETDIIISNYPPGTYIINIFSGSSPVKTFKIIKN